VTDPAGGKSVQCHCQRISFSKLLLSAVKHASVILPNESVTGKSLNFTQEDFSERFSERKRKSGDRVRGWVPHGALSLLTTYSHPCLFETSKSL
jgi:hypothetical protein